MNQQIEVSRNIKQNVDAKCVSGKHERIPRNRLAIATNCAEAHAPKFPLSKTTLLPALGPIYSPGTGRMKVVLLTFPCIAPC